jgi:para-nitrobenzyl esterase
MKKNIKYLKLLLLLFIVDNTYAQPQVNTQYGTIQGVQNGNIFQFLGIPFAMPPVDTLRWKAPKEPEAWLNVLNTTTFKPECAQKSFSQTDTIGKIKGSEDCLYLNVWTPQLDNSERPVMVFIHGGGNQQGSAKDTASNTALYFGKNMAARSNVVVVTIQYRLGALGFLVHPGLENENINNKSGNYAVLDQILALQWVKNNIHLFGGDTSNITIFGESAGGINVGNLLITNLAQGLFHKAIIQSAIPNISAYADEKSKGIEFVNTFSNAMGSDVQKITYMRSLHSDSIVAKYTSPLSGGLLQQNFQHTNDGIIFTQFPQQAIEIGNYNKVPVIIGSNSDEMSLNAPQVVTPTMVTALVNARLPLAYRQQVLALYPPGSNNAEARKSYVDILSDAQFNAPVRRIARCLSISQNEPVWNYWFSHAHTLQQLAPFGAYHGIELFYVFNTLENSQLGTGPLFKAEDDSVQRITRSYWTNFAATGNPNATGLTNWNEFEAGEDCYLEIKALPNNTQCKLKEQKFDLWDEISNQNQCLTTVSVNKNTISNSILLYPNPTNHSINIKSGNKILKVKIFDALGKKIYDGNQTEIDLSKNASGIYTIQIEDKSLVLTKKFVKF